MIFLLKKIIWYDIVGPVEIILKKKTHLIKQSNIGDVVNEISGCNYS